MPRKKGAGPANGQTSAGGEGANNHAYFRQFYAKHPRLLHKRSNKAAFEQWMHDTGATEITPSIRQALQNIKNELRNKSGGKKKKEAPASAVAVAEPAAKARPLDDLEVQIDKVLGYARGLESSRLDRVIELLRLARNEVIVKSAR